MSLPEPLTAGGAKALKAIIDSPSDTLLATDFDGTLAPIVDDPEQAYADPARAQLAWDVLDSLRFLPR